MARLLIIRIKPCDLKIPRNLTTTMRIPLKKTRNTTNDVQTVQLFLPITMQPSFNTDSIEALGSGQHGGVAFHGMEISTDLQSKRRAFCRGGQGWDFRHLGKQLQLANFCQGKRRKTNGSAPFQLEDPFWRAPPNSNQQQKVRKHAF